MREAHQERASCPKIEQPTHRKQAAKTRQESTGLWPRGSVAPIGDIIGNRRVEFHFIKGVRTNTHHIQVILIDHIA